MRWVYETEMYGGKSEDMTKKTILSREKMCRDAISMAESRFKDG